MTEGPGSAPRTDPASSGATGDHTRRRRLTRPGVAIAAVVLYVLALTTVVVVVVGSVRFLGAGVGMPLGEGAGVVEWRDVAPDASGLATLAGIATLASGVLWIPAAVIVTASPLWKRWESVVAWVFLPVAALLLLALQWGALEMAPPRPGLAPFVPVVLAGIAFLLATIGQGRRGVARARLWAQHPAHGA